MARNPNLSYGSDQHGMVCGYHFVPGKPTVSVFSDEALAFLAKSETETPGEFLWLHFALSNSASEPWMRRCLDLPEAFYELMLSDIGSTRLEQDGSALMILLHDVLFDFSFDPSAVATSCLSIQPRLLVSARLKPLRSLDQLRTRVRGGMEFQSTVELLAHLLREQAGVLVDIVRQSTLRVDAIEDRILANLATSSRAELGRLRRVLVRLQRLLAPEPAALFRLLNKPPEWICSGDQQELHQAAEEFSAAVGDSIALGERVKLLQEEMGALVNEQTNRTLFLLTMVTVLALPINLVAGLFGMNVGGIPLAEDANGFWMVVVLLLLLTGFLAYRAFGRKGE
ncbi:MAG: transporter [Luteolibacter sp.]